MENQHTRLLEVPGTLESSVDMQSRNHRERKPSECFLPKLFQTISTVRQTARFT